MLSKEELNISVRNINTSLDVFGGKWKIRILGFLLFHNGRGFNDLMRDIPGISQKVLSAQLKELERDGLVNKDIQNISPIRVHYSLTNNGLSIKPILISLCNWAQTSYYS